LNVIEFISFVDFLHYVIEIQGIYDISFFVRMTCYVFQYLLEIIRLSFFIILMTIKETMTFSLCDDMFMCLNITENHYLGDFQFYINENQGDHDIFFFSHLDAMLCVSILF
jgi:hypothetical protein